MTGDGLAICWRLPNTSGLEVDRTGEGTLPGSWDLWNFCDCGRLLRMDQNLIPIECSTSCGHQSCLVRYTRGVFSGDHSLSNLTQFNFSLSVIVRKGSLPPNPNWLAHLKIEFFLFLLFLYVHTNVVPYPAAAFVNANDSRAMRRVGRGRLVVSPIPNWPELLSPHTNTPPPSVLRGGD